MIKSADKYNLVCTDCLKYITVNIPIGEPLLTATCSCGASMKVTKQAID